MNIAFISRKGGVGKTTSAVTVAGCLSLKAPTVLIDSDANKSALALLRRGAGLPFDVLTER